MCRTALIVALTLVVVLLNCVARLLDRLSVLRDELEQVRAVLRQWEAGSGWAPPRRGPRNAGKLGALLLLSALAHGCTATVCTFQQVPYTDASGTSMWTIRTCYPHVPVGRKTLKPPAAPH